VGFRVPSFNTVCNIWSRVDVPAGPIIPPLAAAPRLQPDCQLRGVGKQSTNQDEPHTWSFGPALLLPAGTDVRDWACWDGVAIDRPDLVEVPKDSGRFYTVTNVDDVAQGFPNEYRVAMLVKNPRWPIPIT